MFFQSNSGVLQVVIGEPPSNAPYNSGYGFMNLERMYVIPWDPAAPMPPDTVYSGGLARSSKGALYVVEGTPSDAEKSLGVPARTINGVAFVTTGAVGQGSTFNAPWGMVSSIGQIHIDATFGLGFADLGAGVVSTVAGISGATPTFTRATAATTVLSNGLIGTVASGSPRSYYDPTTLAYLGYLAEGARTNLCLQSEDFGTTWTLGGTAARTLNTTVAPDGANTADTITAGGSTNDTIGQTIVLTANTAYSTAVFFKAGTATRSRLALFDTVGADTQGFVEFDWTAGVPSTSSSSGATGITYQQFPNSWWRISFNATTDAVNTSHRILIYPDRVGTTGSVIVWGAQLEAASFASSYIATVGTTVTRNADLLVYPLSPWFNNATGTGYAETSRFESGAAAATSILLAATDLNGRLLYLGSTAQPTQITTFDGTTAVTKSSLTSMATGSRKRASAWGVDLVVTGDGAAVQSGAFDGTMGAGTGNLGVGAAPAGGNEWYGTIRRVAYWPTRLPNAQLQGITS